MSSGSIIVATGHYARVEWDESREEYVLKKATDPAKDQSYMLHTLQQRHLQRILFPLGEMSKTETRTLAREFELPVADKPDSQEICFVAGKNYTEFLRQYVGDVDRPGPIVDTRGTVVGEHDGIHAFTIGQRKGLGISSPEPRYVLELRPIDNTVVVGDRADATVPTLSCSRLSFTGSRPAGTFPASIKIRYRTPDRPGIVELTSSDSAQVEFEKPVWGVAPGQLAVFYDGERVIGGGTIDAGKAAA